MPVELKPLGPEHVEDLDAIALDPLTQRFTYVPSPPPPGFGRSWLDRYEQGRRDGSREAFAIVDADDGAFLGIALAVRIDTEARETELGYIVAAEARGRGAATEGVRLLTDWALAQGMQRIELRIDAENEASQRVAERCGYVREGALRSVYFKDGRRTDVIVYSRLPTDP
jgi:RimJ/RimL family protein N-acetyltransferase